LHKVSHKTSPKKPEITRILGFLALKNMTFNFQKSVIKRRIAVFFPRQSSQSKQKELIF
jgi:hypothetical protein